ncbi:MAG: glycoside hydrolase family 130 protein [Deltaproteobacteria bacterium]|nr:glycoside hydrolase family 130 protein [Deltaproteobacteria bacterium]
MAELNITRSRQRLLPDPRRVLARPYLPGEEIILSGGSRSSLLLGRILGLTESEVTAQLASVMREFTTRHRAFGALLDRHFNLVAHNLGPGAQLSVDRCRLIGAYFTHEYAVEAAALFNPSIVPAPDQTGLAPGEQRVIMSLRAVGEGHISSIEFRSGTLDADGELRLDPSGPYLVGGQRTPSATYSKHHFGTKLGELDAGNALSASVMLRLPEHFTLTELEASIAELETNGLPPAILFETIKIIRVLAASSYVTAFPATSTISERVIFPAGPNETRGMEDARFVRFTHDDGISTYYATYTAYDGFGILPQLIETSDFVTFTISTLNGAAAQNKGMALFPRLINGKHMMLSRKDRENLHLATSTDVHYWNDVVELHKPSKAWELLQIGNCGSPIETPEGWLVLTHGVGPMRRYCISALLLDLDDPRRVIGRLRAPLLEPDASEREGYVPNVLYTCGALVHGSRLVVPYGFSDAGIAIATIALPELLTELRDAA